MEGWRTVSARGKNPSTLRRWLVPGLEWGWLVAAAVLEGLNRFLVPLPAWVLVPVTLRFYWFVPLLPLALWAIIRRQPGRHVAALIAATVWLGHAAVMFSPKGADPAAPGLRVMTWNVQRAYHGVDRVARVIADLQPAVVALQEVSRPGAERTDLVTRLEADGALRCSFSPYYPEPDSPGVALCVDPAITLTRIQRRTYHSQGRWSYLFAEAAVDGRTVNLIVPHLVAFAISEVDPLRDHRIVINRLTWASRWHHFEVAELLRLVAGFHDPTIMAGDFNSAPGLALHQRIRARMVDAFAAKGRGLGATYRFGLPIRIDYIYLGGGITPRWAGVGPAGHSDHRPVVAVVALPPLSPAAAPTTS